MKKLLKKLKDGFAPSGGTLFRDGTIEAVPVPQADRADVDGVQEYTFELSFSSEEPYRRWFGYEILGHKKSEVDLTWLKGGTAPLLLNHDPDRQVGVIEKAKISNGRGTAVVRFGKGVLAEEVRQDVLDGIRSNVSVGYRIQKMVLEEEVEGGDSTYRVTDWEPLENSIVAVPADKTVGVGRSDEEPEPIERIQESIMTDEEKKALEAKAKRDAEVAGQDAVTRERKRVSDIQTAARAHNLVELGEKAIREGASFGDFKDLLLAELKNGHQPVGQGEAPTIGLTEKQAKRFSFRNAILSQMPGSGVDGSFERECSDAVAKKFGKAAEGMYVPADVLVVNRDLDIANTTGSYVVSTDLQTGSFIDLLRNRLCLDALGVPMLTGLVGDIAIPKLSAAGTAYWVTEAEAITEGVQTLAQVTGTPKTVAGLTDVSRKLLKQSSMDVEALIMDDLTKILAQAIDVAGLAGTGANGQPTGVQGSATDVTVTAGTPTYTEMLGFIEQLESENALSDSVKWVMTPEVMVKLAATVQHATASTEGFVLSLNSRKCLGYDYVSTNNCPANDAIFGDWTGMVLAMWGTIDLQVNPYFHSTTGSVRVRAMQDVDILVRQAGAFATADVTT